MRKLTILLTFLLCCSFMVSANAKDKNKSTENTTKVEAVIDEDMADETALKEVISVEEMNERLKHSSDEDLLYVKVKIDEEEQVQVYEGFTKSRSLRKQFILNAPTTEMVRLYSTNKATFEQMRKMLSDYEQNNYNFNGYRVIMDKDNDRKLEDGGKLYRLWFMKIEREKQRRGVSFPIGIGIGIGHRHHHRHGGPWIGVGW